MNISSGSMLDSVFYYEGHKYDVYRYDLVTGEYACVVDDDTNHIDWYSGHELYDMIISASFVMSVRFMG